MKVTRMVLHPNGLTSLETREETPEERERRLRLKKMKPEKRLLGERQQTFIVDCCPDIPNLNDKIYQKFTSLLEFDKYIIQLFKEAKLKLPSEKSLMKLVKLHHNASWRDVAHDKYLKELQGE